MVSHAGEGDSGPLSSRNALNAQKGLPVAQPQQRVLASASLEAEEFGSVAPSPQRPDSTAVYAHEASSQPDAGQDGDIHHASAAQIQANGVGAGGRQRGKGEPSEVGEYPPLVCRGINLSGSMDGDYPLPRCPPPSRHKQRSGVHASLGGGKPKKTHTRQCDFFGWIRLWHARERGGGGGVIFPSFPSSSRASEGLA